MYFPFILHNSPNVCKKSFHPFEIMNISQEDIYSLHTDQPNLEPWAAAADTTLHCRKVL